MEAAMNPFSNSPVGRWAQRWRAARDQIRTERAIARLSPQMRRDIGWPDSVSHMAGWRGGLVDGK
jgi:hypothetical protein